jgi:cation diffusion facilitator family transporter
MVANQLDPRLGDAKIRAAQISLIAGAGILIVKALAYIATSSTAILSDAAESAINVTAAALLWSSVAVAARPADPTHPYGHGKAELFSVVVEGVLIAAAAALILLEAARALWQGPELRQLDVGLGLLTLAAAANGALGAYMIRTGRRTDSLAIVADGRHLITDVVTSVGVVIGLLAARLTGWLWLDPLIAVVVAVHLAYVGYGLVRQAVGGLMDQADVETLGRITGALEDCREPSWIDVHSLRARRSGDLHLVVPRYFQVEQLHSLGEALERAVLERAGLAGEIITHFDPCRPHQCPGCIMSDCPVRGAVSSKREPISVERATRSDEPIRERWG